MELRDYQISAKNAALRSLQNNEKNACIISPTGSGKSVIIAAIISDLIKTKPKIKILILAHVKELITQNIEKLLKISPNINAGIYCAGLFRKDKNKQILFATIASAFVDVKYNLLKDKNGQIGHIDLIIVDEAHRINTNEDGMYYKLISTYKEKYNSKVLGLTATAFRTNTGSIIGENNILNYVCYEIQVNDLIKNNYISKPITMGTKNHIDSSKISIKNNDFDCNEVGLEMLKICDNAILEIITKAFDRNHIICFCSNIDHAEKITNKLNDLKIKSAVLHSKLKNNRDEIINDFKEGKTRCLVNVNILTEGFDAPFIDCVILMRATMSPGLYIQMIGRGFRVCPGKENFLVLDFGENIERHGCIDDINTKAKEKSKTGTAPVKFCPNCKCATHISTKICKNCNFQYEFNIDKKLTHVASDNYILKKEIKPVELKVNSVNYYIHKKQNKPDCLKVVYNTGNFGIFSYSEYICLYHDGYARRKASNWWFRRCDVDIPCNIQQALLLIKKTQIPETITIKKNGKYIDIIDYKFKHKLIDGFEIKTTFDDAFDENEDIDM